MKKYLFGKVKDLFGIDPRALGVFRIMLGLVVLYDMVTRISYVKDFYTRSGVLPVKVVLDKFFDKYNWSVLFIHDSSYLVMSIFIIGSLLSIGLILGYKTKLCNILLWIIICSTVNRNIYVNNTGITFLVIIVFLSCFLPLNGRFSLDNLFGKKPIKKIVFNFVTIAILLQVVFLYFFAVLHKTGDEWQKTYNALYYALSIKNLTREYSRYLLSYPELLRALTFFTIKLQFYGSLLLFFPFFIKYNRLIITFFFVSFQLGIALLFSLNIFPYICIAPMVLFLPQFFWNNTAFLQSYLLLIKNKVSGFRLSEYIKSLRHFFYKEDKSVNRFIGNVYSIAINIFMFIFIIYILAYNIYSLDNKKFQKFLPNDHKWLGRTLNITQGWRMFSPYPKRFSLFFEIKGKLINGREVLINYFGQEILKERSYNEKYLSSTFRWRKYIAKVYLYKKLRLHYGKYITRQWNGRNIGGEKLETFKIYAVREKTVKPKEYKKTESNNSKKETLIWSHRCFSKIELKKFKKKIGLK